MTAQRPLTIAVSKGRILKDTLPLLSAAGIELVDDPATTRKLVLDTNQSDVQVMIIRATDVPVFVQHGAADMGVAGKDVLIEHGAEGVYEPLDLGIARCRLMVAVPEGAPPLGRRVRVATKYTRSAEAYFAAQGTQAELIKLYGSMELAPLVGLADCIVDLVDTGNTLKANKLVATELIRPISSRLIVNKGALKMRHAQVSALIRSLSAAVDAAAAA